MLWAVAQNAGLGKVAIPPGVHIVTIVTVMMANHPTAMLV